MVKSSTKKTIAALAANFDRSQFDVLVTAEDAKLRLKTIQEGPSKRLLKLEKDYKNRDTAFSILAEEKIRAKIRRKQNPTEQESTTKTMARHDAYMANISRRPKRTANKTSHHASAPTGSRNWRDWGHDM